MPGVEQAAERLPVEHRHTDADLPRTPSDCEAHDAVQTHGGQHEPDSAENPKQHRRNPRQYLGRAHVLVHGFEVVDSHGGIQLVHLAPEGGGNRNFWRCAGAEMLKITVSAPSAFERRPEEST